MSDDPPSPLKDALKGLGLLLRAAKNVAVKLPTKGVEEAVVTSAREVGRAVENVANAIDREVFGHAVFGKKGKAPRAGTPQEPPSAAGGPSTPTKGDDPKPPDAA